MRLAALPRPGAVDWVGLTSQPLPLADATSWSVVPGCGAAVTFVGTVRDHAEGRQGVTVLEYEAYEEQVERRLQAIVGEARARWPGIGRLVLLHRVGALQLTEISVLVVVSTPHRAEAFDAARWCIDMLKTTVPIWKRERWAEGSAWATGSAEVSEVPVAAGGEGSGAAAGVGPRRGP